MAGDILSRHDLAQRRVQRRRENILQKIGVALVGIVVFIILIAILLRIDAVQFHDVVVEGERHVSEQQVERIVREQFDQRRAFVLPKSNLLLFSRKDTATVLSGVFPRIADLSVERDMLARTVRVNLVERELWMVLCSQGEEVDCVSVSRDGVAYAESPAFSGNLVTKVIDERGEYIQLGEETLTAAIREIILLYTEGSAIPEIANPQFILEKGGDIKIQTAEGWYIVADITSDPHLAYENMIITLREQIGEERSNLEYIDTRFGNRVFYKEK